MKEYIFIKYYYTSNQINQLFEEMQTSVEDHIEDLFSDRIVSCVLYFIDASDSAYFCDLIEVEHTMPLTDELKQHIFNIVKEDVVFVEGLDEDEIGETVLYSALEKQHNLQYARFALIEKNQIIVDETLQ